MEDLPTIQTPIRVGKLTSIIFWTCQEDLETAV
jgi:hypothetical protein